jgi:phage FluMu protein Com
MDVIRCSRCRRTGVVFLDVSQAGERVGLCPRCKEEIRIGQPLTPGDVRRAKRVILYQEAAMARLKGSS